MIMCRNKVLFLFILLKLFTSFSYGQHSRFVQLHLSGGVTASMPSYRFQPMFAGLGPQFSGGFEYFFNKWGIGVEVGSMIHPTQKLFSRFVEERYNAKQQQTFTNAWQTTFGSIGPVFKIGKNKFELDINIAGGLSKIKAPRMVYVKPFEGNNLELFSFQGFDQNQWLMSWNSGLRFIYKFNNNIAWHFKGEYLSVISNDNATYSISFVDLQDRNKNGSFESNDYYESDKYSYADKLDMKAVNVGMGLTFQLARFVAKKPTAMFTFEDDIDEDFIEQEPLVEVKQVHVKQTFQEDQESETDLKPVVEIVKPQDETLKHHELIEKVEQSFSEQNSSKPYVAPESSYDDQAATFLYKAGESYFAANDFESALPCFNKLKSDPTYPHAKYMFAMTLSSMGNCGEALTEFKDFVANYKENDVRTFDIIFKSQLERCKQVLVPDHEQIVANNMAEGISYKIQFIATGKSDATFPKLSQINEIGKEFLQTRNIFRYNLEPYFDLDHAQKDMYKVRKMGFPDAFIAMYQDGQRVNTLHHSK